MSHWQIAFCSEVHPEVKAPGSLHGSKGGVIYKEAETRLCRARGIDRRFISVQIGFHGQLEGTDAEEEIGILDIHRLCFAHRLMLFLTGKHLASGRRTHRHIYSLSEAVCISWLSTHLIKRPKVKTQVQSPGSTHSKICYHSIIILYNKQLTWWKQLHFQFKFRWFVGKITI